MTDGPSRHERPTPRVLLLAGPGGVGKSSMAARIAVQPHWDHLSEDDHWVLLKAGRPAGELRTPEEERKVQESVLAQVAERIAAGRNIVLEFILYQDPPHPLLNYQNGLTRRGIAFETRVLTAQVEAILQRMAARGRPGDADVGAARRNIVHQLACLISPHIDARLLIDTSDTTLEALYDRHFQTMVEA